MLSNALRLINPSLLDKIDGIYFIEKPKDLFSAGTESSYYDSQIIIYRKGLENKSALVNKIIHEIGHHLHETTERQNFLTYRKDFFIKDRIYLSADSKFSAEEDFATNFEFFIKNKEILKKDLLKIYTWFDKNFNNKYNLRECK